MKVEYGSADICGAEFVFVYVTGIIDGVKNGVKIKCKKFAALVWNAYFCSDKNHRV